MQSWITYPITLKGLRVELICLEKDHFADLNLLAKDKRIWKFYPYDGSNSTVFLNLLDSWLLEREKGSRLPFIIFHKVDNKIIGGTSFLDIQPEHKKLEIGSTWLHPNYWGTEVNFEIKLLLLTYCFEELKAIRVQLKTDENNLRSRKAIEKIGGRFEGILRNHMLRDDNTKRHSAYYSIIEEEWTANKKRLIGLFQEKVNIIQCKRTVIEALKFNTKS